MKKHVYKDEAVNPENPQFVEEMFLVQPIFNTDEDGFVEQVSAGIGKDGKEYGDPVPLEPPIGFQAPPDMMQMIKAMVHRQVLERESLEYDPIEELEDFDIAEDIAEFGPTPYEAVFDPSTGESVELRNLRLAREAAERPQGARQSPPAPVPSTEAESGGEDAGGSPEIPPAPPRRARPKRTST